MSSYLTFYLVPKKTRTKYKDDGTSEEIEITKGEPLVLLSYSRSSSIYQIINGELHPPFIGMGEETHYMELTTQKMDEVIRSYQWELKKSEKLYNNKLEVISKVGEKSYIQDLIDDKEVLDEMEATMTTLQYLRSLVEEVTYSDFEKVLINID